jgi:hypothetical protein
MIKILSIAISMMVVLLVSFFSDPDSKVTFTAVVPDNVTPGEDCLVKVTLATNGISGYAQLQQVLPAGLKAKPVETLGARVEVKDNIVSFIWTELPTDNLLTVSYSIQTDPNSSAPATLAGAFVYMQNKQAITVEMDPVTIDFSEATKNATVNNGDVIRKIIAVTPESGQYNVEIVIHKKEGEHTARFTDNIPEGYTVTNISASNAKFMYSNGQATFIWNELPAEKTFKISYTLEATGSEYGNPAVEGMLVYGAEGESQTSIATNDGGFLIPTSQEVSPSPSADMTAATTPSSTTANNTSAITPEDVAHTTPAESVPDVIASNLVAQETEKTASSKLITNIPQPQKGIFYKIQIAATRKSPARNDQYFESRYHLGQHVDITEHEGWRKYMLGNFDTFMSANDFSLRLREKIPDAFVVAYRGGERITLREAVSGNVTAAN